MHLEELSYLGLGTVVQRAHPQDGVNLTGLASDGPSDGGDLDKALDHFAGPARCNPWARPLNLAPFLQQAG